MILAIGIAGATIVLIAFVLNQTGVWKTSDLTYDLVNFVGGGLLVWYAILIGSWPFAILNGVWTAVALRDVLVTLSKKSQQ